MNPYETLGVDKDAKPEDIKKAYRRKSRKSHPDVNSAPNAAEKFDKVQKAFLILSDKKKRAEWDETGTVGERKGPDAIDVILEIFDGALKAIVEGGFRDERGQPLSLGRYMRESLGHQIDTQRKLIPNIDARVTRLRVYEGKVKYTGPGINLIDARIEELLLESVQTKERVREKLEQLEAAKELLSFYTFPEVSKPMPQHTTFNWRLP